MSEVTCKGCAQLGTACGKCSRCYDAAQSELSDLRQQLAQHAIAIREMNVTEAALREELSRYKSGHESLYDKWAAAEQRNSELEIAIMSALDDSAEDAQSGEIVIQTEDYEALVALLVKPTESGASEPRCCDLFPKCVCHEGADGL